MTQTTILWPMCALAGLTFLVLLLIPLRRFRAAFAGKVSREDFRFGESPRVPPGVGIPNRNYMNLLEIPLLFYVACLVLFAMSNIVLMVIWLRVARMLQA